MESGKERGIKRVTRPIDYITSAVTPEQYPGGDWPEVAFAGRSNVGKSSLINALAGRRQAARVSKRPGKTQTINFFRMGTGLRFVDLPGYGYAKVSHSVMQSWSTMIQTYLTTRTCLRLVLVIVDIRREPSELDLMLAEWLRAKQLRWQVVVTKSDKISKSRRWPRIQAISRQLDVPPADVQPVSARTFENIEGLWQLIGREVGAAQEADGQDGERQP